MSTHKTLKAPGLGNSAGKLFKSIFGGTATKVGGGMGDALISGKRPTLRTRSGAGGGAKRVKPRR